MSVGGQLVDCQLVDGMVFGDWPVGAHGSRLVNGMMFDSMLFSIHPVDGRLIGSMVFGSRRVDNTFLKSGESSCASELLEKTWANLTTAPLATTQ